MNIQPPSLRRTIKGESSRTHLQKGPAGVSLPDILESLDDWIALVERSVKISPPEIPSQEVCRLAAKRLGVRALNRHGIVGALLQHIELCCGYLPCIPVGSPSEEEFVVDSSRFEEDVDYRNQVQLYELGLESQSLFSFEDEFAGPFIGWRQMFDRHRPKKDIQVPVASDSHKYLVDWRTKLSQRMEGAWNQATKMYQIYVWLVQIHLGLDEPSNEARNSVLYMWFLYGLEGRLEKVLKYKTAYQWAVALKQKELPDPIELFKGDRPDYLLGGAVGHRLKRELVQHAGRPACVRLFQDLYFAKRGSNPVDDRFVESSLEKHFQTLTAHPDQDIPDEFIRHVARTCKEVYVPPVPLTRFESHEETQVESQEQYVDNPLAQLAKFDLGSWIEQVEMEEEAVVTNSGKDGHLPRRPKVNWRPGTGKIPSMGSCVENSRVKGGSFGYFNPGDEGLRPARGYLWGYCRYKTVVVEIRVPDPEWDDRVHSWEVPARDAWSKRILCKPVALLEPFKVRVITRGSAEAYHLCRRYQPRIHREMARQEPFRLTQGPTSPRDIDRLLAKASFCSETHDGFWVSGDYEAATDGLHPDLSEAAMDKICDVLNISIEDRSVLLAALTRHRIAWVGQGRMNDLWSAEEDGMIWKDQNWGQLMGSPVSFPVLCLVNAAITRMWFEKEMGRRFRLAEMPLLVNGDDILFWCPSDAAYERWKETVTTAGFKPSVGKNYTSSDYLIINSQVWKIKKTVDFYGQATWTNLGPLPSINLGLLFGTTKSESSHALEKSMFGSHELQRDSLRMRAFDFVAGFPDDEDLMMSVFINYWKKQLKAYPKEVSWWVHPSYGGLGLPVTREVSITDRQRKLAALIHVSQSDIESRVSLRALAQPLPTYVQAFMRSWAKVMRKAGVKMVPDGTKGQAEGWSLLRHFCVMGCSSTDPEGYDAYLQSFNDLWKKSKNHWAKPLSFRKCVAGPTQKFGLDSRIYVS